MCMYHTLLSTYGVRLSVHVHVHVLVYVHMCMCVYICVHTVNAAGGRRRRSGAREVGGGDQPAEARVLVLAGNGLAEAHHLQ